jgi:multiple sugar transport system ATP-binding protein
MIAGLEEISDGTISIGDRVVNELPPKDRDIAMVFQSYALYPHMTVRENLEFGLKIKKTPRAEIDRLVNDAATILGITHLLERKPKELSGGQRQRVAVGRAIVRQPAVFLFDEPLSNLDAKLRVQMRAEITKLQQRLQTTCVYVTHDQIEAMTMGHRIAVMNGGKIQQIGTPIDVYDHPQNLFVANFIGTPPMNFVKATISGEKLVAGTFELPIPEKLRATGAANQGKKIILGIRPENITDSPANVHGETAVVAAEVEMVEPLGHEVIIHGRTGEDLLVGSLGSHQLPKVGERIDLVVGLDSIHLFDAATEQRLGSA